jgi:hypothetical protein
VNQFEEETRLARNKNAFQLSCKNFCLDFLKTLIRRNEKLVRVMRIFFASLFVLLVVATSSETDVCADSRTCSACSEHLECFFCQVNSEWGPQGR